MISVTWEFFLKEEYSNGGGLMPLLTHISSWILRDPIQRLSVLQRREGVAAGGGEWSWNLLSVQVASK